MNRDTPPKTPLFCAYADCRASLALTRPSPESGLRVRFPDSIPECGLIRRKGFFRRKEDARLIPRWRCMACQRTFSSARLTPAFRQKRRRINGELERLLASGVSMRRAALLLGVNRKTV